MLVYFASNVKQHAVSDPLSGIRLCYLSMSRPPAHGFLIGRDDYKIKELLAFFNSS